MSALKQSDLCVDLTSECRPDAAVGGPCMSQLTSKCPCARHSMFSKRLAIAALLKVVYSMGNNDLLWCIHTRPHGLRPRSTTRSSPPTASVTASSNAAAFKMRSAFMMKAMEYMVGGTGLSSLCSISYRARSLVQVILRVCVCQGKVWMC